jgi:hypothetical protein
MDFAGRIGEHFQQVVFFLFRDLDDIEQIVFLPAGLPLGFDCLGGIPGIHGSSYLLANIVDFAKHVCILMP